MVRKRTARSARRKRRLLIVDNHPLMRRGLTAQINAEPDLVVCAEARLPVLVLSKHDSPQYVRRAFESGTNGYVAKQEMTENLLVAIRSVLLGDPYGAPAP
jgi:DNA-binding NarL/FixJ family response regulator